MIPISVKGMAIMMPGRHGKGAGLDDQQQVNTQHGRAKGHAQVAENP